MKGIFKNLFIFVIIMLFLNSITFLRKKQEKQHEKTMTDLLSMAPQQVTRFKIYPRVTKPAYTPLVFSVPDPLIDDFFHALTDITPYRLNHDTVKSRDQSWCLVFATESDVIQLSFHIPAEKNGIVAGHPLGLGWFQSQNLFQWYQKYKDRWLKPDRKEGG